MSRPAIAQPREGIGQATQLLGNLPYRHLG